MQETINERIRYIANVVYAGNITAMAKSALISRTTINSIIGEKEVYPGYEVIRRIAEIPSVDISLDWLITGKGEMLKAEQPASIDPTLIAELKEEINDLKSENNQLKGENKILRELAGLAERKESKSKSA